MSESRAAAQGGVTSMLTYFRTGQYYLNKGGPYRKIFPEVLQISDGKYHVDYAYPLAPMDSTHIREIPELIAKHGVSSFKIFMFYGSHGLHGASSTQRDFLMIGEDERYDVAHFEFVMRGIQRAREALPEKARQVSLSLHCETAEIMTAYSRIVEGDRKMKGLAAYHASRPPHSEGLAVSKSLVGHIPGGLAHANIIGSIIFSGMSGSAIADAAGLGQVEMKAMIDEGYDPEFSAAITAASATVGPIIPPSIPMVLYGAMAEVSVGALFLGGFIPGLLLGVGMMILVYFISIKRKYLKSNKFDLKEVWESFKGAFLAIITPIIIIGGILLGVFTPTEAAVVATVYAFVLGFIVYREMTLAILLKNLINATVTTSSIIFICALVLIF